MIYDFCHSRILRYTPKSSSRIKLPVASQTKQNTELTSSNAVQNAFHIIARMRPCCHGYCYVWKMAWNRAADISASILAAVKKYKLCFICFVVACRSWCFARFPIFVARQMSIPGYVGDPRKSGDPTPSMHVELLPGQMSKKMLENTSPPFSKRIPISPSAPPKSACVPRMYCCPMQMPTIWLLYEHACPAQIKKKDS